MKTLNSPWRKNAAAIYGAPKDSKLYGSVEIDITDVELFIAQKRKKGLKITLTHVLASAVGKIIGKDIPELNCYVKRGKIVQRNSVDASISVLMKSGEMGSVIVKGVDKMSLQEVSNYINQKVADVKQGEETKATSNKHLLAKIPWPFRRWVFTLLKFIAVDQAISIKGLGLSPSGFGSFILSNIGTLGLDLGFGALMPGSSVAMAMFIGSAKKKPVVIKDEVVIRKMLTVSVTLDHRIVDGKHGGMLFRGLNRRLNSLAEL